MTREPSFSSAEALRFGWRTTMANLKTLLAIGAFGAFLAMLHQALTGDAHHARPLLALVVQVLQTGVTMAFIRTALKLHDGDKVDLSRPGELLTGFFPYLLTSVLYGLIVGGGMVLLIVPGVIWAVQFGFATFVSVDRKLDPIAALQESSHLTKGERWHLLAFGLAALGVNLVGALAFGVGLLVTIPTTTIGAAYVFRRLQATVEHAPPALGLPPTPATSH